MIQTPHRGIYEFLWSEHKNSVLSVSIKAFQGIASKLGKRPMLLALLKKLAEHAYEEETERYNALLNAYDEIKAVLNRKERQIIIETLLADEEEASRLIYEMPLKYDLKTLSGCRLFFPREQGAYKFWDAQDKPGLWMCFGAFQLHLTPMQVISKIALSAEIDPKEVLLLLNKIKTGLDYEEYSMYPENLRTLLQKHVMVAMPGRKSVWLNPRICIDDLTENINLLEVGQLETSALAIEKIWDESEYLPDVISKAPDEKDFKESFNPQALPFVKWNTSFNCEEAYKELVERYISRLAIDNGHI
jgi:hypothetical protein